MANLDYCVVAAGVQSTSSRRMDKKRTLRAATSARKSRPRREERAFGEINVDELIKYTGGGSDSRTVQLGLGLGPVSTPREFGHIGGNLAGRIGDNKFVARFSSVPQSFSWEQLVTEPLHFVRLISVCRVAGRPRRAPQVEYAVDNRAKCRDAKCRRVLLQHDLRVGKIAPAFKRAGGACSMFVSFSPRVWGRCARHLFIWESARRARLTQVGTLESDTVVPPGVPLP